MIIYKIFIYRRGDTEVLMKIRDGRYRDISLSAIEKNGKYDVRM